MIITLAYDRAGLRLELPDLNVRAVLRKPAAAPLPDPEAALANAMAQPLGTLPLTQLARGRRNAVIVVSDVTRPVPNALLLRPIIAALSEAGLATDAITILVGTGLHGPNEGAVLEGMLGPQIARTIKVVNHDARDAASHAHLGTTARGTEVIVDRRYARAELKILTGLIEPHFMAGFSGGPKAILPGIAAAETIGAIHGYAMLSDPRCRNNNFEDNPLQDELVEAARMAGADFLCNVTLSEDRRITGVFCGDVVEAHRAGCLHARKECVAYIEEPADIVVTSAAGYPLDTTYYQAAKGVCAALEIVRPGGMIVVAAGCAEGIGSADYERLFMETGTPEALRERISDTRKWTIDQWNAQMVLRGCDKGRVLFYTDGISREKISKCLVEPVESVERAVEMGLVAYGPDASIVVIPEGPYVAAEVRSHSSA